MTTRPMTAEEEKELIKARLRELWPKPQTKAQRLADGATKPTAAIAQDVALSSEALTDRLREERRHNRQIAIAQAVLDRAYAATRAVQQEIELLPYHRRSTTVGRGDSDANLHISPEDQLWGRV